VIRGAVAHLRAGRPVVVPTDTVYGLAVDATRPGALDRLYELKERPAELPIAVLVATVEQAAGIVEIGATARRLADEHWPGALTIVLPAHEGGTLGVRLPAHPVPRALAARIGPLSTTSANLHGQPPPAEASAVAAVFGHAPDLLVIDGGPCPGTASTVVRVGDDGSVEVLRQGNVDLAAGGPLQRGSSTEGPPAAR
jgi:L-threonylcarbamoyladenylate synthase